MTTMTTIGYGDIVPRNYLEVGYTVIIEVFSTFIFAFSMNMIMSIFADSSDEEKTKA